MAPKKILTDAAKALSKDSTRKESAAGIKRGIDSTERLLEAYRLEILTKNASAEEALEIQKGKSSLDESDDKIKRLTRQEKSD